MKKALIVIALVFLFCSNLMAQGDDALARNSLKGLTGIGVGVELLHSDEEQNGLTRAQIQTDVELRLRMAGIKVLTSEENTKTPGMPYLPYKHFYPGGKEQTWGNERGIGRITHGIRTGRGWDGSSHKLKVESSEIGRG